MSRDTKTTWTADLRRSVWCALGLSIGYTLLLLLAATGLMRHETSGIPIPADAVWAGILIGVGSVGWAFMPISKSRTDTGYRHDRLPSLLFAAVLVSTAIHLAVMCVWPLIIGPRAAPDSLIANLTTDLLAMATLACFILAVQSFGLATVVSLVRLRVPWVLFAVVVLLVVLGVSGWQGVAVLENPASVTGLTVWAGVAVVGLGVMTLIARTLGPKRHQL